MNMFREGVEVRCDGRWDVGMPADVDDSRNEYGTSATTGYRNNQELELDVHNIILITLQVI